jgi:hypothetical protein
MLGEVMQLVIRMKCMNNHCSCIMQIKLGYFNLELIGILGEKISLKSIKLFHTDIWNSILSDRQ